MPDADPTYTVVTGKLSGLLAKIRQTGVPNTATNAWLETLGFKSSNDRSMLNVLRYIGLTDQSNKPTPAWREYRGGNHKAVLGRAIRSGYQDLYAVYPNAHEQSNADLANVFGTQTTHGKPTIDKMVLTFKALAADAEFTTQGGQASPKDGTQDEGGAETNGGSNNKSALSQTRTVGGVTVNINVQLTLPDGADEQTYEAFFKAMRNHLLTDPK